jgi:hypothetical protein
MMQVLKDVAKHSGTYGDGHYEVSISDKGSVTITTVFNNAQQVHTVTLTEDQWDRLSEWIDWALSYRDVEC